MHSNLQSGVEILCTANHGLSLDRHHLTEVCALSHADSGTISWTHSWGFTDAQQVTEVFETCGVPVPRPRCGLVTHYAVSSDTRW